MLPIDATGQLPCQFRHENTKNINNKGEVMSLSLEDLKGELRETYLRTEEVLSGMDAYIAKLEKRITTLEGQTAAITAAIYSDDEPPTPEPIIILRA